MGAVPALGWGSRRGGYDALSNPSIYNLPYSQHYSIRAHQMFQVALFSVRATSSPVDDERAPTSELPLCRTRHCSSHCPLCLAVSRCVSLCLAAQHFQGLGHHPAVEYRLNAVDPHNNQYLTIDVFVRNPVGGGFAIWEFINMSRWSTSRGGHYFCADNWATSFASACIKRDILSHALGCK